MPVLRWTRRGARLCVSEHATLEDAAAAQALAAAGAYVTLMGAELVGEGETCPVSVNDVRYHQVRAARWHVVVRHPDGGRGVLSVHPDEAAAQSEAARVALLIGAARVKAEPAPA